MILLSTQLHIPCKDADDILSQPDLGGRQSMMRKIRGDLSRQLGAHIGRGFRHQPVDVLG
jgi:hypothetical protein